MWKCTACTGKSVWALEGGAEQHAIYTSWQNHAPCTTGLHKQLLKAECKGSGLKWRFRSKHRREKSRRWRRVGWNTDRKMSGGERRERLSLKERKRRIFLVWSLLIFKDWVWQEALLMKQLFFKLKKKSMSLSWTLNIGHVWKAWLCVMSNSVSNLPNSRKHTLPVLFAQEKGIAFPSQAFLILLSSEASYNYDHPNYQ